MQGIWLNGQRPKSKKAIRLAAEAGEIDGLIIEATSMFGNEFGGFAADLPDGVTIYFVGPDPHTKRNFYGQLFRKNGKLVVK